MSKGSFLSGRLGLAGARIPHADRHGLLWLSRGKLYVENGTLLFLAAGSDEIDPGLYQIPYQMVSMILAGPGTTITHDVLRILARHGTLLAAVGEGGVKLYTAPPMGQGRSDVARAHARLWADEKERNRIARKMYAWRFGEVFPNRDISVLRGMEGGRLREAYRLIAQRYGVEWKGRRYDRENPEAADIPNQAINHAATFVEAAADIAVAAVGALPPLGFIHEDSSNAFTLDIADLWRVEVTLPLAFSVAARVLKNRELSLEREIRYEAARVFRKKKLIPSMIDQIKELIHVGDDSRDA
ncbi:type I-E CRISPR-associated endonuclease Cas1e [Hydrogenibacillus schlegelii]|uniref:CRISPR-associated endonuclease Cas1 n=1 Tax=Hydrogenibacillus schlegelii TaxID=1484 RepID=A0A132MHK0_HYDSH|nr:type I-E CRISPR-associated endonuclease Cas1e [Hydrogenibacillus schlegelii]KWW97235.1 CRISPR-associated protein Cas1 [Hydrogenibacillus schlegelii]OAR04286.1 type I-E CRISPR-associated endonuclease Cas1 [Hydrogenibacillus schlegelii]